MNTKRNLRPENQRLLAFLQPHFPGLDLRVKRILDGSLKRSWRVYCPDVLWTEELGRKFVELGFTDLWGGRDLKFAGNGGQFCIFVRGHDELA